MNSNEKKLWRTGHYRISEGAFYHRGGFANPNQFRKMINNKWTFWEMFSTGWYYI